MRLRFLLTTLLIPAAAIAAEQQPQAQQEQPAEQQPQVQQQAADPYIERNKRVQEALRQRGLYNGPIIGEIGPNTQAAIAQFQLSVPMPVSGMLDDATLAALGVEPVSTASAGAVEASTGAATGASAPATPKGN